MQESTHTLVSSLYMAYAYDHVHRKCIRIRVCIYYTGANTHLHEYAHAHLQMPIPLFIHCADFRIPIKI